MQQRECKEPESVAIKGTCRRLEGRVALVTGAAQGFGQAIAERLAAEGAMLALLDRQEGRLETVARSLEEAGATTVSLTADIANRSEVRGAVQQTAGRFGRVGRRCHRGPTGAGRRQCRENRCQCHRRRLLTEAHRT